jgi:hypothetical protein
MELGAVIDSPTVARMAGVVERLRSQAAAIDRPPLTRASRDGPAPMSFAQERTWRTSQTLEQSAGYTTVLRARIRGPLDVAALRRSIDRIVGRHEVLRTTFGERDRQLIQVVHPPEPIELPVVDLAGAPDAEAQADELLAREGRIAFDLQRAPPLRVRLVRTAPGEHQLFWIDHHMISDAWSRGVFLEELRLLYEAIRRGEPPPLPDDLPVQYRDFAVWERRRWRPSTPHYQAELAWWRSALRDPPPPLRFPFTRASPCSDAVASDGVIFCEVGPELSRGLARFGRETRATYYMVVLAAFAAQVAIETGRDDLALGTYATGRTLAATQAMIGFFSNPVTLRLRLSPDISFRQVLARVRACVIGTSPHADFPYELLYEGLLADGITPPEINSIVINIPEQATQPIAELKLRLLAGPTRAMPWGFTFAVDRHGGAGACAVQFDARVYDPELVRGFIARFQRLAARVSAHPDRPIGDALAHT